MASMPLKKGDSYGKASCDPNGADSKRSGACFYVALPPSDLLAAQVCGALGFPVIYEGRRIQVLIGRPLANGERARIELAFEEVLQKFQETRHLRVRREGR